MTVAEWNALRPRAQQIADEVAARHGLTAVELRSIRRLPAHVAARAEVTLRMRDELRGANGKPVGCYRIAQYVGNAGASRTVHSILQRLAK